MDLGKCPRVLIITVNPLSSTSSNGKTFASFFKGYPKECIAQLYFHREIPSSSVCENYYKISDESIIKNLLGRSKKTGNKVYMQDREERLIPQNINNKLKKSSIVRFARTLVWLSLDLGKEDVKNWLDEFNPQIIFFCGGDANYLYSKVIGLSKAYNAKIIYYITDDYVLPYFSINPFYLINRLWTRNMFKKMCINSSLILTIGDKMSRAYKEKYGIECEKIMNLVDIETDKIEETSFKKNNLKFVYAGGLHTNRWKTLSLIGKSFQRLEREGIKASIEIYSQNKPQEKILKAMNNSHYSKYCGSLDEKGVKRILREADVLVHVESFDYISQRVTCLSVSTKISEYMATGKCILAFGPKDVASIEYLKETDSGFVVTSTKSQDIDNILREIIINPQKRDLYAIQALQIAKENHDIKKRRNEFQQKIKSYYL